MRFLLLMILVLSVAVVPVSATGVTVPTVPESGEDWMPESPDSFAQGLWELVKSAIGLIHPDIQQAASICMRVFGMVLLLSILQSFPGSRKETTQLIGAVSIGVLLLEHTNSLIHLGTQTVVEMVEYGKLLLPVMAGAMAAQGGVTASTAIYGGTVLFSTVMGTFVSEMLIPMVYAYLALSVANGAIGEDAMKKLRDFLKWLMIWGMKIVLYVFTGYIGITGVVSGTTDAAALKAAKLTISGVVPVVGGILADASEAVLVSAGVVKNTAGIYGLLAILSICIGPFFRIGIHYLLLKTTAALCGIFGYKAATDLIEDFSGAMGMVLGMTGSACLLLLIGTVCFLKGVG